MEDGVKKKKKIHIVALFDEHKKFIFTTFYNRVFFCKKICQKNSMCDRKNLVFLSLIAFLLHQICGNRRKEEKYLEVATVNFFKTIYKDQQGFSAKILIHEFTNLCCFFCTMDQQKRYFHVDLDC